MDQIKYKYFITAVVMMVIPLSGLSIDIYVPSLPSVAQYFDAPKYLVQLSITVFMLGIGFTQLIGGSFSDSFGRRKPLVISMFVFVLLCFWIPYASSIYALLFLRLIQGATAGLFIVPMRSIAVDIYEGAEFQKMVSYMTMAWGLGTIVAPAIGGYLQQHLGWKSCFYFLGIYSGIGLLFLYYMLPETSKHKHPFRLKPTLARYKETLFNANFLLGLIFMGLLYSCLILFAIVGPFIIQVVMGYTPVQFGYVALLMGLAWFLGNTTSRFILHISIKKKTTYLLWIMFIISIIAVFDAIVFPLNIYNLVIPTFILFWAAGSVYPAFLARSISFNKTASGSVSAILGSFVFLVAAISSSAGVFLKSTSQIPLAVTFLAIVIICALIFYYDNKISKVLAS